MAANAAKTNHPVHELIKNRWSPRSFSSMPVEREKLLSILEAARWAPSCFGEEPWRYVVATSDDPEGLKAAQSAVMEGNSWAFNAPVLICSIARSTFAYNDKPNRWAEHDLGAASMSMFLEAFSQGLVMHEMGGYDPEKAREVFGIPEGYESLAMIAVGYPDSPEKIKDNEKWYAGEIAERTRKPMEEIVFANRFGQPMK
jgi:nitroreductase